MEWISWTETTDLKTVRREGGGTGPNAEAALGYGGYNEPAEAVSGITEQWNGSSWTEVADLNTARTQELLEWVVLTIRQL